MNLIQHLQTVRDSRTQPEYPLWVILVLVIMGTMSGCTGYRPLADFVNRHQNDLLEVMGLPQERLPSLSTLRRIMVRVDFVSFTAAFNRWAQENCPVANGEQVPIDGKGIKASLRDYDQSYQDFVSVVSAFSVQQGVVLGLEPMRNRDCSEIKTAHLLLDHLQLKGVCFSLDALHAQKKRSSKSLPLAMITLTHCEQGLHHSCYSVCILIPKNSHRSPC
jgi:DDE_Tnp_1-associated